MTTHDCVVMHGVNIKDVFLCDSREGAMALAEEKARGDVDSWHDWIVSTVGPEGIGDDHATFNKRDYE